MVVVAVPIGVGALSFEASATEPSVDFNRDIRPILSEKCFLCHGPDAQERKGGEKSLGGLRLDTLGGQRQVHDGHAAVVPGQPNASTLLQRVLTSDADEAMPPAKTGKHVTPAEAALLRRWIEAGARFSTHWAYEKPIRPALPPVRQPAWIRQGLDAFVLARLEAEGLSPQPEADRAILARRVALDLTGLPPSPAEVERFLADPDPAAYEHFVGVMLEKEAYGEHWARLWLDLARYADSAGYADDPPRTMWPYRDYVIRAFNRNLPFDMFTIEQLAGDLLPDPTDEQLKATGFHRNTMTNSEGGTSDEEFRNVAIVDRVNTTFAVWMGTSMACAQCHTHKYDPISQREYFQLFAFFNNTADADRPDEAPWLEFYEGERRERRDRLEAALAELDGKFRAAVPELTSAAVDWARVFPATLPWQSPRPDSFRAESGVAMKRLEDQSILVAPNGTNTTQDTFTVEIPFDTDTKLTALRLQALADDFLGKKGPGLNGNFAVRRVRASVTPVPNQAGPLVRYVRLERAGRGPLQLAEVEVFSSGANVAAQGEARQGTASEDRRARRAIDGVTGDAFDAEAATRSAAKDDAWWELDLKTARPVERLVVWSPTGSKDQLQGFTVIALDVERHPVWQRPGNAEPNPSTTFSLLEAREIEFATAVADVNQPELDEALVATDKPQDAPTRPRRATRGEKGWSIGEATGQDHALSLLPTKPIEIPRGATLRVTIQQQSSTERQFLGRFRLQVTDDGRASEHLQTPPAVLAALQTPEAQRDDAQRGRVVDYFVRHVAPSFSNERERHAALQKQRDELKPFTVPVYRELSGKDRRTTRVQIRGNFLNTAEEVSEGVPAAWPPLPDGAPRNRLTLARWLMSEDNPLTARVLANRFWEQIFGTGIVRTSEEFGSQGEAPVNQPLLDWLATELHAQHWDLKAFLKTLVTSAAYRQSTHVTPEAQEKDPDNRLASRGPRFRMSAEMVRDQALAAAGLLSAKMYGPSVRPVRPALDLRAAFGGNLDWQASGGEDRYRRGLYTEWRRTSPYPSMVTFDAPSREVCTLRRNRSNTPLQALVTLNDPVYLEAAQGLARRMFQAASSTEGRLRQGYRIVLARQPSRAELDELGQLQRDLVEEFSRDPVKATVFANEPLGRPSFEVAPAELAAWTAVANVLLNLDETLMKR